MKMPQLNTLRKLATFSLLFGLGLTSSSLFAGALNISQSALEIADGVEPNVMVLNDDSGSMNWSVLVSGTNQGRYYIAGPIHHFGYLYVQSDPENPHSGVAPSVEALNVFAGFWDANGYNSSEWRGVWRVRNSTFNPVYYNPNTQYTPWKGVDNSGATFTNANPVAARVDPYVSGSATFNLTVNNIFQSRMPHNTIFNSHYDINENVYPASYYTWTDTDLDGNVDFDDAHQLTEIRTGGACGGTAVCPTSFTRTGTREDCGGDGLTTSTITCTAAQELQNYANFYSYYRRRELTAKAAITTVLDPITSIRVGFAAINNFSGNRIPVNSMNVSSASGNKKTLFDRIFLTQSSGGTPLRRNLEAMGNYFACSNNNIFGTGASSPGNNNCPVQASPAGECQQNYTILMTDGFWNGNPPNNIHNADSDGNNNGTPKGPFDGASFADNSGHTLADVAMHYYERDLHTSLQDDVPTTTRDRGRYVGGTNPFETMHQHMSTYTVGIGVKGTLGSNPTNVTDNPANFTNPVVTGWPAPGTDAQKIDDLRHAAWNGRGDFLSAADQTALTASLQAIFDEIQAGTGSASAVAFNTQDLQSGSRVFRAFFDTNLNTGSLVAQNISITGVVSPVENWDAAKELDSKTDTATDTRNIVTYDPNAFNGIPFQWASLNTTQQNQLKAPTITSNPPTPTQLGKNRLNYLRGQSENEGSNANTGQLRSRPIVAGKLGDIIHSAPVFVGAPPFSGRDVAPFPDITGDLYSEFVSASSSRREVVYIGANDGMLHGFDANSGEEVFAYIPNSIFSSLSQLAVPDYMHRYFVDMTPAVNDVYIAPTSGTNAGTSSWNTVAVGGLGVGGPGYFALNLTNPASLNSEASAAGNIMWEFTQGDDVGSGATNNNLNLGAHVREPIIAMSNVDGAGGQKRWVAIFGNGYNSASPDGDAELYVLFLDGGLDGTWTRGSDFIKINTGNGKAESSDGTTPNGLGAVQAIDTNGDGTVDAVYAGDYQGNVYRFNLNSTTVGGLTNPSNRPVQKLFTASYNGGGITQPITNRPVVIKHPQYDGYIVIVGTGSYFTVNDTTSTDIQSIYGLWDDFVDTSDNIVPVNYSKLQEQFFMNASNTNGLTVRTLTDTSFNWGTIGQRKQGWVIDLDVTSGGSVEFPGERAVRNFLLRGSFVFVNTVIPKSGSACTTGPGSFTLGFNPVTGGSGAASVFDTNNDGIFDSSDNVGGLDNAASVVSGIRSEKATLTDSSTIGNRLVSQGSDKSISDIGINTTGKGGKTLGRHSWREIDL